MRCNTYSCHRDRGFSLKELLIVVAILAVLAAILLPVLARSRQDGYRTAEMSAMRQMGLAAQIYFEREGARALGTLPLVEAGDLPKEMCASPRDSIPTGLANYLLSASRLSVRTTPYKNSFMGLREFGHTSDSAHLREIEDAPSSGWLLNLIDTEKPVPMPLAYRGPYHRLLFDGSVVRRQLAPMDCSDPDGSSTKVPCVTTKSVFSDDRTPS